MSLDTKATELKKMSEKRAKIAQEERIEKEINKNVDELLKQVENEDGFTEGIIFPVKNMIIVDELRREWQVAESRWKEEEQKRKEEENKRKEAEQKNAILIDFLKTQGFSEEKIKAELEKLNKK